MSAQDSNRDARPEKPEAVEKDRPVDCAEWGDLPFRIDVEVGRAVTTIGRLLKLKEGDVIPLDRPAHEAVGLTVQGRALGRAEVSAGEKNAVAHVVHLGEGKR